MNLTGRGLPHIQVHKKVGPTPVHDMHSLQIWLAEMLGEMEEKLEALEERAPGHGSDGSDCSDTDGVSEAEPEPEPEPEPVPVLVRRFP
jgi:hypothetical protein